MTHDTHLANSLEEFASGDSCSVPEKFDHYLDTVSQSGATGAPWHLLRPLMRAKLLEAIDSFEGDAGQPADSRDAALAAFDSFADAPFTIQRLCELLLSPGRYYRRRDKFMRGLLKCLSVVSCVDQHGKKIVQDDEPSQTEASEAGGEVVGQVGQRQRAGSRDASPSVDRAEFKTAGAEADRPLSPMAPPISPVPRVRSPGTRHQAAAHHQLLPGEYSPRPVATHSVANGNCQTGVAYVESGAAKRRKLSGAEQPFDQPRLLSPDVQQRQRPAAEADAFAEGSAPAGAEAAVEMERVPAEAVADEDAHVTVQGAPAVVEATPDVDRQAHDAAQDAPEAAQHSPDAVDHAQDAPKSTQSAPDAPQDAPVTEKVAGGAAQATIDAVVIPDSASDTHDVEEDMHDAEGDMRDGEEDMRDGEEDMRDGEEDMRDGKEDMRDGKEDMRDGEEDMRDGEEDMHDAEEVTQDATQVASDAQSAAQDTATQAAQGECLVGNDTAAAEVDTNVVMAETADDGAPPTEAAPFEGAEPCSSAAGDN